MPDESRVPSPNPRLLPILSLLFFCSGISALIYQVLWLRVLALVFGVTVYATSTVLASFMAGLAIGSAVAGRLADRVRNPLAWFGAVEILVGLSALVSQVGFRALERAYVWIHPSLAESIAALTLVRFVGSFAILIVPTMLMGATLPLVVKSSLADSEGFGGKVGLLYATNTAGAITGTVLAGFLLIPAIGISASFTLAAALNVVVGFGALGLSRRVAFAAPKPKVDRVSAAFSRVQVLVLIVFGLSGMTAIALEIVWVRVLVLLVRPTTYAFTIMLATVLVGISAGSAAITPFMRRRWNWIAVLALLELAIACSSLLSFSALSLSPSAYQAIGGWFSGPRIDRLELLLVAAALAIVPTTLLMGAAFPVGLRLCAEAGDPATTGARIGLFYSVNVFGAIVGSIVGGFLLIPYLGTQGSLMVLGALTCAAGLLLLTEWPGRAAILTGVVALGVFGAAVIGVPNPFTVLAAQTSPGDRPLWRREGVQTTAAVHARRIEGQPRRILFLESFHQADDTPPMVYTHRRIGLLPVLLHENPSSALVIGLGGGATAGAAARHPAVRVDVVELSREVIESSEWFRHINGGVLHLSNVRLRIDDGRNFMLLTPNRYDLVTADIIHPVQAGSGNLYSREYFQLVRRVLGDDGVVLQWNGSESDFEYKLVMRTFLSVFPETTLWADGSLMVGSLKPLRVSRAAFEKKLRSPELGRFMRMMGFDDFERLLSIYMAGPGELQAFTGPGPILTDDRPRVEYFLSLPQQSPAVDHSSLKGDVSRIVTP